MFPKHPCFYVSPGCLLNMHTIRFYSWSGLGPGDRKHFDLERFPSEPHPLESLEDAAPVQKAMALSHSVPFMAAVAVTPRVNTSGPWEVTSNSGEWKGCPKKLSQYPRKSTVPCTAHATHW